MQTATSTPRDIYQEIQGWPTVFEAELVSLVQVDVKGNVEESTLETRMVEILPGKVVMVKQPNGDGMHKKREGLLSVETFNRSNLEKKHVQIHPLSLCREHPFSWHRYMDGQLLPGISGTSVKCEIPSFPFPNFPLFVPFFVFVLFFSSIEFGQITWATGAGCDFLSDCNVNGECFFGADKSMFRKHWKNYPRRRKVENRVLENRVWALQTNDPWMSAGSLPLWAVFL